ncbi:50S ribosomal protein L33 [Candidatus Pacearchaeota archaeon]|nr:50S ribosomal protein L33 [Candidatus Pacearchaeota archaeon]
MAQGKFSKTIVKLRCNDCKRVNYATRKNKKLVERKLDLSKYCSWCRKHTAHKEVKK